MAIRYKKTIKRYMDNGEMKEKESAMKLIREVVLILLVRQIIPKIKTLTVQLNAFQIKLKQIMTLIAYLIFIKIKQRNVRHKYPISKRHKEWYKTYFL